MRKIMFGEFSGQGCPSREMEHWSGREMRRERRQGGLKHPGTVPRREVGLLASERQPGRG